MVRVIIYGFHKAEKTGYEFSLDLPGVPRIGDQVEAVHEEMDVRILVEQVVWRDDEDVWLGGRVISREPVDR